MVPHKRLYRILPSGLEVRCSCARSQRGSSSQGRQACGHDTLEGHVCLWAFGPMYGACGLLNGFNLEYDTESCYPKYITHVFAYINIYIYIYKYLSLYKYLEYVHTYIHAYIHTYIPTYYVHTYIRTYVRTYIHTYTMYICTCVYMHMCLHVDMYTSTYM